MNEQISTLASSASQNPDSTLKRPRLVLRLSFAGSRNLKDNECERLKTTLFQILQIIRNQLVWLAPGTADSNDNNKPSISKFFVNEPPVLRLVTGLCEGADAVACQVLEKIIGPDLETELAAVLPFDAVTYRQSRKPDFHPEFDRQLARCSWVQVLDGIYDKPDHSVDQDRTKLANERRARAYRAQSAFLLRHSDILIAAINLDDKNGKAGGTMETIRAALTFGLPVIVIHTGKENYNVYLIDPSNPNENLESALADPGQNHNNYHARLKTWVNQLITGSDEPTYSGNKDNENLLEEYFNFTKTEIDEKSDKWYFWVRIKSWKYFILFFPSGPRLEPDKKYKSFEHYRKQATDLNYHYSDLYRGAFLANYLMVIAAVILAVFSLTLLTGVTADCLSQWVLFVLLILGFLKLIFVGLITLNTHQANREKWNDKAIDYRYLAERLRSMYYLPLAGSHQPSKTTSFTSRKIQQSAVDWLFNSLVRAISPADLDLEHTEIVMIPAYDASDTYKTTVTINKQLTISAKDVVIQVRDRWIGEQIKYHAGNAATMHGIHVFIEKAALYLGLAIIAIVSADLILISGKLFHWLSDGWLNFAKTATPWLIMISAILPAIIAALGGIRFQSECQRLAERSKAMQTILEKRDKEIAQQTLDRIDRDKELAHCQPSNLRPPQSHDSYLGSWALDSLYLTEHVATSFSQEVSEWAVLYAKEVSDPG
ncbi:hypothetical protein C8R27_11076 [Nitrosomonas ureae]|uniref:hypothetical protein n=1 Tax=Nitrosomonas ureae TaxID=44577 RepID=UPI000D77588B|nr:hypothetical protein [Nitrosomonas ureae]PXX15537.1 hypothetical protein C8R27_11076 [Nitrosomonas ureae]